MSKSVTSQSEKWQGDRVMNALIVVILAGVALRSLGAVLSAGGSRPWLPMALLALFGVFLLLTIWTQVNSYIKPTFYFVVQSTLIVSLLLLYPQRDYYAVMFGILSVQVTRIYPRPIGLRWIALFIILTVVTLIYGLGWPDALPFTVIYAALFFALAYFVVLKNQAEVAQADSEFLLEELREAPEIAGTCGAD